MRSTRRRRTPQGVRELKLLAMAIVGVTYGSRTPHGVRELKQ